MDHILLAKSTRLMDHLLLVQCASSPEHSSAVDKAAKHSVRVDFDKFELKWRAANCERQMRAYPLWRRSSDTLPARYRASAASKRPPHHHGTHHQLPPATNHAHQGPWSATASRHGATGRQRQERCLDHGPQAMVSTDAHRWPNTPHHRLTTLPCGTATR